MGALALLTFALSGCVSFASGHAKSGTNWISFAVHCNTAGNPDSTTECSGAGSGILGGKHFVGKTINFTGGSVCLYSPCGEGGEIDAKGKGRWGNQAVNFDFYGNDDDDTPALADEMKVTIHAAPDRVFDFNCRDCFELTTTPGP